MYNPWYDFCNNFRYGVNNQLSEEELLDEAYNSTEEIFEDDSENDNFISGDHEPNFVTLSRVQNKPILPPVIVMGGRLKEAIEDDTTEDDDEGFVEGIAMKFWLQTVTKYFSPM